MAKLNNATIGFILNGITNRIATIESTCQDEDITQDLNRLMEDINLITIEVFKQLL